MCCSSNTLTQMKLIKKTKLIYKPFEEQREKNPVMWLRLTGVSRPPPAEHSRYASPRRSKYVESMLYCILALESDAMHFAFGQVHMMMLSCVVALRSSVGVRFQSIYNLQSNTTWSARCSHGAKLKTHKHTHASPASWWQPVWRMSNWNMQLHRVLFGGRDLSAPRRFAQSRIQPTSRLYGVALPVKKHPDEFVCAITNDAPISV